MGMNVAIVDDEQSLCRALARLLRSAGLHPHTFLSAEEFLASPLQGAFGCLLLDVQLGAMSGPELHKRMLEHGDCTPIVYMTAQDEPEAEAEARRLGCAGFFRKTESGTRIIERLREIGCESRARECR
jgi:FixJ family two-component response regulator